MVEARRRALVADDLTGALDTGVHFLARGTEPKVVVAGPDPVPAGAIALPDAGEAADVLVVDTETRLLSTKDAYRHVQQVSHLLLEHGWIPSYKKIDSTLRGNVGTEIDAMLDALQWQVAAIVPAVPSAGRIVRDGECIVRGVLLHMSESGADNLTPHTTSSVLEIVCSQSRRRGQLIDWRAVAQSADLLASDLASCVDRGAELLVFDATSQDEIRRILDGLNRLDLNVLHVGASGLAKAMSAHENLPTDNQAPAHIRNRAPGGGRGLFVVGSRMQTTARQVEQLAHLKDRVGVITARPIAQARADVDELGRVVQAAGEVLASGRHAVLTMTANQEQYTASDAQSARQRAQEIAEFLGRWAQMVLAMSDVTTLVLTGGSTALAVIRAIGAGALRLVAEVDRGLPLCETRLKGGRNLTIVTKSGGFGQQDVFARIADELDGL